MIIYILLLFQFIFVQTVKHQKPIAEKVWSVRCKKNEYVLNDCNWCWCGPNYHFQCKARVCEEVDVFGHFKDTIQEIDVGMEGHGAWRSRLTSCTPGVQYQRGTLLCICDDDGNWPNPVCRDLFRILHSVEVTEKTEEATSQSCSPTKLYLVGCNTCFCPSSGKLDANLCTNRTCSDGDPVLEPKDDEEPTELNPEPKYAVEKSRVDDQESTDVDAEIIDADAEPRDPTQVEINTDKTIRELEIYAQCKTQKAYVIDNENCQCLANNRIICQEQDMNIISERKVERDSYSKSKSSVCGEKVRAIITVACNFCKCTGDGHMYCSTKKCAPSSKTLSRALRKVPKSSTHVKAPVDDLECIPGTSYMRGCNKCYCKIEKGKKIFSCSVKPCPKSQDDLANMVKDCVPDTTYETDCFTCTCEVINGEKHELCTISSRCWEKLVLKDNDFKSVDSLYGHCEPRRVYRKGCNTCRCLSDGKVVMCTDRPCVARSEEPVEVEIVPLQQAVSEACPEGHSYKIECNLCVCLHNGNALCTTSDCSKNKLN